MPSVAFTSLGFTPGAGDFDDALARASLGARQAGQCEFERVSILGAF